jgi:endopolyphosphatase
MVRFTGSVLLFAAFALALPTERTQLPLRESQHALDQAKKPSTPSRKLQGKFLHITGKLLYLHCICCSLADSLHPDFHPDPFYKHGSSSADEHACHSGSGDAGILGAAKTDCDSPIALVNATFQWINDNLKDEVDFVIWTGDSARHDNDERYPRNESQVVGQNELLVSKFVEVFGKDDDIDDRDPTNDFIVPIIPTFGNNDILPHNIFEPGPNKWTRKYTSVWNKFIPEEQRHSFERGGWFFVEVIRNRLAVFSLNTLYFFDSNSAVDGCDAKSQPGYEHLEWLGVQLELLRQRGMKAIITGHVPPARTESKQSWDETCWQKYTLWMTQYRDVVVGAVYGHANIDHFLIQDSRDLEYGFQTEADMTAGIVLQADKSVSTQSKSTYLNELRERWSELPKPPSGLSYATANEDGSVSKSKKSKKQKKREKFLKSIGGPWAERFSLSLVSPSVVPNYYPTLRVFEYNITGLEDLHPSVHSSSAAATAGVELGSGIGEDTDIWEETERDEHTKEIHDQEIPHDLKKKKPKKGKPPFKVPHGPDSTAPPGPAYSPQTFTWLSYTQYYANLTYINNDFPRHDGKVSDDTLLAVGTATAPGLKEFKYELEYHTKEDKIYHMKDLTMRSYLDLAEQIGRKEPEKIPALKGSRVAEGTTKKHKNRVWHNFVKRAFVLTKPDEELEDQFG